MTDMPSILSARPGSGYVARVDDLAYTYEGVFSRDSIAAALAEHLSGGKVHIRSAGSAPAGHINPDVITVLAERGLTLTEAYLRRSPPAWCTPPTSSSRWAAASLPDLSRQALPRLDVADPNGQPLDTVRDVRDDSQARVTAVVHDLGS